MLLGNRLKTIASKIDKGFIVADIGTDHAHLPIFLISEGISKKVIATEILPCPYKRAQQNIKKSGYQDFIEIRFGSGFKPIKAGEADVAVIAGMGANTIIDIIEESRETANSFKKLILQPMRYQPKLREYLFTIGYRIVDEDVVQEADKYYEIIVTRRANVTCYDEIDLFVGPVLRHKKTSVIKDYINYRIEKLQKVIDTLNTANSRAAQIALLERQKEVRALKEALK